MRTDTYTKAVLTVIALLLAVIAFRPLFGPVTTASAQGQFAGVQAAGSGALEFFDTHTGEMWSYSPDLDGGDAGQLVVKRRLTKLGQPLTVEYWRYKKK